MVLSAALNAPPQVGPSQLIVSGGQTSGLSLSPSQTSSSRLLELPAPSLLPVSLSFGPLPLSPLLLAPPLPLEEPDAPDDDPPDDDPDAPDEEPPEEEPPEDDELVPPSFVQPAFGGGVPMVRIARAEPLAAPPHVALFESQPTTSPSFAM